MSIVGMIYYGSIYERTGAGKIVRSFYDKNKLYAEYGIDEVRIFSLTGILGKPEKEKPKKYKAIKSIIKRILIKSYWGTKFYLDRTLFKNGAAAVEKYFKQSDQKEDALIFHEIPSCYSYLVYCEKYNIKEKKYVLVEHTNGDLWKMIKINYPKVIGMEYEKHLNRIGDMCEKKASKLIFVSEFSARNFKDLKPEYASKVQVITNGIDKFDSAPLQRNYETIRLVTVGTVNVRKNQISIIEAINKIQSNSIFLTVVGDGYSLNECKKKVEEYGLQKQVCLLGARDDVVSILNGANVFIMASYDEGLPISGIEALRSGLPIIITDVGGCNELIRNNGLLITPDEECIRNAICWINDNRDTARTMGQNSYSLFLEKYCVDIMVQRYAELFTEVIAR